MEAVVSAPKVVKYDTMSQQGFLIMKKYRKNRLINYLITKNCRIGHPINQLQNQK